jgi:hypothetical protein
VGRWTLHDILPRRILEALSVTMSIFILCGRGMADDDDDEATLEVDGADIVISWR